MTMLDEKISAMDFTAVQRMFIGRKPSFEKGYDAVMNEYNPKTHKVNSKIYRKDKKIKVPIDGKFDPVTGEQLFKSKDVPRVRVSVPVQRVLVERSVGFLFGIPVSYECTNDDTERRKELYKSVLKVMTDNKMEYNDKRLARSLFSERECAEIWYFALDDEGKPSDIRLRLCSPSRGDGLFPHFDEYDRMDSFARSYSTTGEDDRKIHHLDVYTSEMLHRYSDEDGKWQQSETPKKHGFSKIPVVYYRQEESEWECVQPVIERIEDLLSNWGDTNDYFGSPSYFVHGEIKGFAEKGEQGRVYQGNEGADMKVLSWDSSPASISHELATLTNIVFSYTQTPDVSFETMKQLGGNTSGVAIRLMFTDPHMKASVKIEQFGEMFTRRCNIIKNGIATSLKAIPEEDVDSLVMTPKFTPYSPKNEKEMIEMINMSTGGKATMSQQEGVRKNPIVSNADSVMTEMKQEQKEETAAQMALNASNG